MRRNDVRAMLVGACVAAVLGLAGPASARQMDARDAPDVSGPLDEVDRQCGGDAVGYAGRTVAKISYCIYLYQFDPLGETDLTRDYGVLWLQVNVDAANGWCSTRNRLTIEVPEGTDIHAGAPPQPASVRKPAPLQVELDATADGNALQAGNVAQAITLYPRELVPKRAGNVLSSTWAGRSGAKLGFALGAELGWSALDPPQDLRGGLDGLRFAQGC